MIGGLTQDEYLAGVALAESNGICRPTFRQRLRRGWSLGRATSEEVHDTQKVLTDEDGHDIVDLLRRGRSTQYIADVYGVCNETVRLRAIRARRQRAERKERERDQ